MLVMVKGFYYSIRNITNVAMHVCPLTRVTGLEDCCFRNSGTHTSDIQNTWQSRTGAGRITGDDFIVLHQSIKRKDLLTVFI